MRAMKLLASLKRNIKKLRFRRIGFFLLSLLVVASCMVLGGLKDGSLQAQSVPTAVRSNPWQYAAFPVENFQAYTSLYGYRTSPTDGTTKFHYGLDMAAPLGSYVRNWWTGRVVELSDNTGCGTAIKIQFLANDLTNGFPSAIAFNIAENGNATFKGNRVQ